ncbi:unnamed protein product, partial [Choristocarpus tenellus]
MMNRQMKDETIALCCLLPSALMVALEVLELMHKKGLAAEEVVYRSL